jgi:uncharacterized protein YqgC (DUF456 family)
MDTALQVLLWAIAVALVVVGIIGTVLPAMPGSTLVLAGLVMAAWLEDFAHVGTTPIVILVLLTALTYAADFAASALGVKRVGASRRAIIGAALGALVGLFFGLPGLLLGPFVGAAVGEYSVHRDPEQAGRAGFGAWLGMVIGVAAKLALIMAMLGVYATARLL